MGTRFDHGAPFLTVPGDGEEAEEDEPDPFLEELGKQLQKPIVDPWRGAYAEQIKKAALWQTSVSTNAVAPLIWNTTGSGVNWNYTPTSSSSATYFSADQLNT